MEFIKNTFSNSTHRFTLFGRSVSKISIFILMTFFLLLQKEANSQTHSNITIGTTATTTTGGWSGSGTSIDPYKFTPTATTSYILNTDLEAKLNSANGYVLITTQISPTGTTVAGTGTVIFSTGITGTSTNSSDKTFTITANSNITINTSCILSLTTNTDAASSKANYSYKVTNLDFTSATGNIVINSPIKTIPQSTSYAAKGANGGNVKLTTTIGTITVASSGSIETNGQQNTNTVDYFVDTRPFKYPGGDGGNITLNGIGGIAISGTVTTYGGIEYLSNYIGSYPGSVTVNTNNVSTTGYFGQTAATTFYAGNFIKKGTGIFEIYSLTFGGRSLANDSVYNAYDTVYAGTLKLMAANALTTIGGVSKFADLYVTGGTAAGGGIFDLGGFNQTVGTISGDGTITSSSGTPTLSLSYNNNKKTTLISTFSGLLTGSLALYKDYTQNTNSNYQVNI